MRAFLLTIILALFCPIYAAAAQLDQHSNNAADALSEDQIIAGLKEALQVSTVKAVAVTGKSDGFLNNEAIRILLPPKIQAVGKGMRLIGMGDEVDDLEISMNRAAEHATPQAKPIFLAALKKMTFDDARHILSGDATAATEYFQSTCSADLTAAFAPIVHRSMEKVGLVQKYNRVIKNAPGGSALAGEFDLDKYVVDKTLEGLFYMLGQEEAKIRRDPAAQSTELLKEVFGGK